MVVESEEGEGILGLVVWMRVRRVVTWTIGIARIIVITLSRIDSVSLTKTGASACGEIPWKSSAVSSVGLAVRNLRLLQSQIISHG